MTHPLIKALLDAGEKLPAPLRDELIAHHPELREVLLDTLGDETLLQADSPGGGLAPGHALDVLVAAGDVAAIAPTLKSFQTLTSDDVLYSHFIYLLPELGAAIVEPVLSLTEELEQDRWWGLCEMLMKTEVRDERIFALIERTVRAEPAAAGLFAEYGDERAIVILQEVFGGLRLELEGGLMTNQDMAEVEEALTALGGQLSPRHQARFDRAMAIRDSTREQWLGAMGLHEDSAPQKRSSPKIGRNEPCWCGSGKKYKKCHWASDRGAS